MHFKDGLTGCAIWQSKRPGPCNTFPVNEPNYVSELDKGIYVLLNTKFQRLCTWVDTLICPEDSVLLRWRRADGTLRANLSQRQHAYVNRVFREAYSDCYRVRDPLPTREWRDLRRVEDEWR
jgi:hypothetical protein